LDLFITKEFEGGILDLFILRELLAHARKARADEVRLFGRGFEWINHKQVEDVLVKELQM